MTLVISYILIGFICLFLMGVFDDDYPMDNFGCIMTVILWPIIAIILILLVIYWIPAWIYKLGKKIKEIWTK